MAILSENGIKQVESLTNRLKNIDFDLIVTSPFERTRQTTEIILKSINKPLETSDLFIERKRPTVIEGLNYYHPKAVEIKNHIQTNYHDPEFRHSDEETFLEMKERALKALKFLEEINEKNVLVVTHSDFIICLLGLMIFGDEFSAKADLRFVATFKSTNTEITLCEFNDRWRIRTWNEYAHLG